MTKTWMKAVAVAAFGALGLFAGAAQAAQCSSTAANFETWKKQFSDEARAKGVGSRALSALAGTRYAYPTIGADRHQGGFHVSFEQFMSKRGGGYVASRGRQLRQSEAALFNSIEERYGVPPGPLLAIWGFETAFGRDHGNQNMLSSITTLAYDCRRSPFFTDQLYAALTLIDKGTLSAETRGSMHGEIGQTQFLPKTVLEYGVGSLETGSGALMSTANYLKAHGWQKGAGYQQGEANFAAIQAWNSAPVYQRAIATVGRQIDGR